MHFIPILKCGFCDPCNPHLKNVASYLSLRTNMISCKAQLHYCLSLFCSSFPEKSYFAYINCFLVQVFSFFFFVFVSHLLSIVFLLCLLFMVFPPFTPFLVLLSLYWGSLSVSPCLSRAIVEQHYDTAH